MGNLLFFENEYSLKPEKTINLLHVKLTSTMDKNKPALCLTPNQILPFFVTHESPDVLEEWRLAIKRQILLVDKLEDPELDISSVVAKERVTARSVRQSRKQPQPRTSVSLVPLAEVPEAKPPADIPDHVVEEGQTLRQELEERQRILEARERDFQCRLATFEAEQSSRHDRDQMRREMHLRMMRGVAGARLFKGKWKRTFLWLADNRLFFCWADGPEKSKSVDGFFISDVTVVDTALPTSRASSSNTLNVTRDTPNSSSSSLVSMGGKSVNLSESASDRKSSDVNIITLRTSDSSMAFRFETQELQQEWLTMLTSTLADQQQQQQHQTENLATLQILDSVESHQIQDTIADSMTRRSSAMDASMISESANLEKSITA
eukprot:TRINITY_DN7767_c0_g1_i1.p1 TRINITY_DN7767_c0_g1~~TRINITY_DN7767_c0_g1_i1.p1  ORF type:complete len:378 (-),score=88.56 TRINITY_DN7767_c0_g1_i1:162-1295(-)